MCYSSHACSNLIGICHMMIIESYFFKNFFNRACFGTTKYCHAWLKNMVNTCTHSHTFILYDCKLRTQLPWLSLWLTLLLVQPCSIPDCLYLHDFGSQEDSFTKDDLVSAFTRYAHLDLVVLFNFRSLISFILHKGVHFGSKINWFSTNKINCILVSIIVS